MLKFISGVFVAVISALLLVVITPPVQRWAKSTEKQISVDDIKSILISSSVRASFITDKDDGWLHLVSLRNTGSDDLANLTVAITDKAGRGLQGAGDIIPLYQGEKPTIQMADGKLTLTFGLLKADEVIAFWVRTRDDETVVARATQQGVNVIYPSDPAANTSSSEFILIEVTAVFLGLSIGFVLTAMAYTRMMRRAGVDPSNLGKADDTKSS